MGPFLFDVPGFGSRLTEEQSSLQQMKFIKKTIVRELRFSIPIHRYKESFQKLVCPDTRNKSKLFRETAIIVP